MKVFVLFEEGSHTYFEAYMLGEASRLDIMLMKPLETKRNIVVYEPKFTFHGKGFTLTAFYEVEHNKFESIWLNCWTEKPTYAKAVVHTI